VETDLTQEHGKQARQASRQVELTKLIGKSWLEGGAWSRLTVATFPSFSCNLFYT